MDGSNDDDDDGLNYKKSLYFHGVLMLGPQSREVMHKNVPRLL